MSIDCAASDDLPEKNRRAKILTIAGKIAALKATIFLGPFAFAVKPAIEAYIVKAKGQPDNNQSEDFA